ncbi:V-type proton ATPase subunit C isoform X3 [Bactrocera dorsalis]|uniref:V-type proton ATPase subunit C isoform X3 n=1 Tax=Bactrocera dorsalis TaxID=27457 RepID=A0ABM3JHQ2_BACDO|nr:V-type proton ATPase subunit C isoform X3 [Bactrocera dorsalis]
MSEYWLISAPGDKTCQQTFDTMNNLTSKQNNLCNNYKFHIPDLKVGTLDQLVGLSDDLGKLDTYVEQITRKVAAYLGEVLEDQRDKLHENLLANNSPGPPDDNTHAHSHSELTGKASNLSNSRDTTTTTTTTTCSACHTGSLNNCSSSEASAASASEREFDLCASSPVCACDECAASANVSASVSASGVSACASASATATTLEADECYPFTSSSLNVPTCHASSVIASASANAYAYACTSAADYASAAVVANNASYCSTSAPTTMVADERRHAAATTTTSTTTASKFINSFSSSSNNNNNNTCNINNNNRLGLTISCSGANMLQLHQTHQQHHHHHHQQQQPQHHEPLHLQHPLLQQHHHHQHHSHHQQQQLHHHHHQHQSHHHQHQSPLSDGGEGHEQQNLKGSNSTSDLSDTFDWWFHRHKRNSKKSRSSPVSSCCGSSSQGRSSPDTDLGEPPAFPLSPADLSVYITRFQWDMAKYPIKQSLRNIADIISKQIGQIDADLKTKSTAYNSLKGNLQNLEKKQTGSLLTRNLADLVKKEHFILDSEYLTTLLVIVPKILANDWLANYEKITDMIVPRSSQMITQDNDYCLFNVTLFKKVVEEFKLHARERKFIVRDFVYNEEELAAGKNEMTKLITDKKKQFGPLVRWLKVNFSEAFCALVHVKALRVFVESVLRYGLPVNFQAILIEPNKKSVKRLRECLNQLYGHLDGASAGGQSNASIDNVDIPGLGFGQSEYFPYVFYKLNIDMVETAKI